MNNGRELLSKIIVEDCEIWQLIHNVKERQNQSQCSQEIENQDTDKFYPLCLKLTM